MNNETFRAEYTPQHSEVLQVARDAAKYLLPRRSQPRRWLFLMVLILGYVVVCDLIFSAAFQNFVSRYVGYAAAPWLSVGPVIAVSFLILLRWSKWSRKRCTDWLEQHAPHPSFVFVADDDKLRWTSERSGSWIDYRAIDRLFVTPENLGIIYSGSVTYVPRTTLANEAEFRSLTGFVLSKIRDDARQASLSDPSINNLLQQPAEDSA
ncbi:hypothetical protein [Anderseniella sp. Alg231-50]|uniref:hypothetical protein n=1 Tax=Anderseniella sp. Alg231-50 TaxID=1922226 RepID=UPI000D555895